MIVIKAVLPLPDNLVYYDFCLLRIIARMSSALDPPAGAAAGAGSAGAGATSATGAGAGSGVGCGAGSAVAVGEGAVSCTGGAVVASLVPDVAGAIMPAGL